jgi:hypothetical protein
MLEIESVKKSTLSEEEKAKKIIQIKKDLEKKLNEIKGKDLENEVKQAEESLKTQQDKENKRVDNFKKYVKVLKDSKTKAEDL